MKLSIKKFFTVCKTEISSAPNFNLAGRSSLTTYPADKCRKTQVDADFRDEKFATR